MKKNILFLCTGNSCRSQMAEGFGRKYKKNNFNFFSAGISKQGLNPNAIAVMSEVGIDISSQYSNTISELPDIKIDYVFTVCSHAHDSCPHFPKSKIIHVGFDDPPSLAIKVEDEDKKLDIYRKVRDEIKLFIQSIEDHLK